MSEVLKKAPKKQKTKSSMQLEILEEPEETALYTILRRPYLTSETIPLSIIGEIMRHHFPSNELIMPFSENHGIYKIKINDLLVGSVRNWEYNRPPDMARCPDIARHIYNSKKPIDTMLYLSFNNLKDIFEVLDGIHRITALKIIKEENSKPLDLLCEGDFGSGNDAKWLYNQYILVNIRFNSPLGDLIEVFKNLNKSQVVPDLYIRDTKKEKKDLIEAIANEWYVKYKKHFSPSSNPNTGNTTRNKFIELLDKIYDKHKIDELGGNKLRFLLEDANNKISTNISSDVTVSIRLKCRESGCYLFLYKNDKLEKFI